jgi:integrase
MGMTHLGHQVMPIVGHRSDSSNPALSYLARLGKGSRPAQARAIRTIVSLLCDGGQYREVHEMPWATLTPEHALALRARLVAAYKPATANRILAAFRGVMREAWRQGLLDVDRLHRICDLPCVRGKSAPTGRALEPAEVGALYRAAGVRCRALLSVLLSGGLRREEAAHLTVADVQEEVNNIADLGVSTNHRSTGSMETGLTPRDSSRKDAKSEGVSEFPNPRGVGNGNDRGPKLVPLTPRIRLRVQGKGDRERWVHLAGVAASDVLAQRACLARGGREVLPTDRLLELLTGSGVWSQLRRLAKAAGVGHFTPHDLRRTFISVGLAHGIDLATMQAMAGHADPKTTARYDRRGEVAQAGAACVLAGTMVASAQRSDDSAA